MDDKKKKVTLITVCSLLLVAMVVALIISGEGNSDMNDNIKDVSGSQKAVSALCQTTDYQQTCLQSLDGQNSTNPKELIEVAFKVAIDYLKEAIKNSTAIQEAQKDPRAKGALDACGELANTAIEDFNRSYSKFAGFDITNVDDALLDMKIWLSGAITHQETCLDGFNEVQGDAGEKMKKILKTSMQMTSNALAMVAEISTFLESMGMQGFQSRRLLSEDLPVLGHGDDLPGWMDFERRELTAVRPQKIKPDVVVAKDGSGNYKTINEALIALPKDSKRRVIMYIKEGVYKEQVRINSTMKHLMMIGDGPTKTRITGDLNFIDGIGTYHTATVAVQGDDFIARDIGFENSAGAEKHQAVALRVSADKAIFYNCHMDGYQDTLYAHTYRQFYRDCVISGTIDFVFGDSAAVFQGCTLLIRKPLGNQQNIVTAQGRKDLRQPTGLVIQNCTFKADSEFHLVRHQFKNYLGRPWKEYSRTIIMESFLDDLIHPDGWLPWNADFALKTLFYTEFNNRGPASPKGKRVQWEGIKELPSNRIQRFTANPFLDGTRWIPPTRVPYAASFIFPVPKEDPNTKYSPVVPEENKDLGLTTTLNKDAFRAITPNETTTPSGPPSPPPPTPPPPPPPTPISNIAVAPALSPQGSAASPAEPQTVPMIPETGEVIIDLSPIPAPAPAPAQISDLNVADPASSPSLSPVTTPQSNEAASPPLTPSGGSALSPQSDATVSTPPPTAASSPQLDATVSSTPPTSSASSPQSDATVSASPPTSASGPQSGADTAAAAAPQSSNQDTGAAAPQSSNPLADAPSQTFTS